MDRTVVAHAIDKLAERFPRYDWEYRKTPGGEGDEVGFDWHGPADEDVMVMVYRGKSLGEQFRRQGFFFFNYAYGGDYQALSHSRYNRITVSEGQMYVGQPFSGYALLGNESEEVTVVGVLVKVEAFYRDFLPLLSRDSQLMKFFLGPRNNLYSEQFKQVSIPRSSGIRDVLELMAVEYAQNRKGSQEIVESLALALTMAVGREWRESNSPERGTSASQAVIDAIASDLQGVRLSSVARTLGYHPNYLSALVRKETGKTFSELVQEQRMQRAEMLIERTTLSIEDVAQLSGYSSTSNFYKVYSGYFGHSPRRGAGA